MLLEEIKITGRKMENILSKIKPRNECMTIYVKGSTGGIKIMWKPTEIIVDYWITMKRILMGQFFPLGNRE